MPLSLRSDYLIQEFADIKLTKLKTKMNQQEEKRYRLTIIFLIVVNVVVLTAWWATSGSDHDHPWPKRENFKKDFFERELSLDKNQKEKFFNLTREHMQKIHEVYDEVEGLKRDYQRLFFTQPDNKAAIDSITMLIGQKRAAIDTSMIHHFYRLRSLCNQEQTLKFDSMMVRFQMRGDRFPEPKDGEQPNPHDNNK